MRLARVVVSPIGLVSAGCAAVAAAAVWSTSGTGDYVVRGPVAGDNPAPAIDALAHGQLGSFVVHQPLMGLVSLLLRLPFVAVADLMHGGALASYRLGALACLLSVPVLIAWIGREQPLAGRALGWRERTALGVAGVTMLIVPPTRQALSAGHPEELLAGVLAAAAVLMALDDRPSVAGVLLGLAVGTKQWAVVAVLPVLVALTAGRLRALTIAAAAAAATILPMAVGDPSAFAQAGREVGATHLVNPLSAWWPVAGVVHAPMATVRVLPWGLTRTEASTLVAGLVVGCGWGLGLRGWRLVRRDDALALLAVVMLMRFVGDPLPIVYYATPTVVALALWEVIVRGRVPVLTVLLGGALALAAAPRVGLPSGVMNAVTLATILATAGYLLRACGVVGPRVHLSSDMGPRAGRPAKAVAPAADR